MSICSKLLALVFIVGLAACSAKDPELNKSVFPATPVGAPDTTLTFSQYVDNTSDQIYLALKTAKGDVKDPYFGKYTVKNAAEMRSPFELPVPEHCTKASESSELGFLFIHGLTDSPYLMKGLADDLLKHANFSCATMRGVVLPGHGTIAGDTLDMKHEDWSKAVEYGIKTLNDDEQIKRVYLVGFSTGTALIVRQMAESNIGDAKVKGLIMLSTAMKANDPLASLAGVIDIFKNWLDEYPEFDAARYTSFSANAGEQFYEYTKPIDAQKNEYKLDIPMMMVVSADDSTIDPQAALDIFCAGSNYQHNTLIWYQSADTKDSLLLSGEKKPTGCNKDLKNIFIQSLEANPIDTKYYTSDNNTRYFVRNIAHTATSISPENMHYGPTGAYPQCKHYYGTPEFKLCSDVSPPQLFDDIVYAEAPQRQAIEKDKKLYRRGTFNPFYTDMLSKIITFIDDVEAY